MSPSRSLLVSVALLALFAAEALSGTCESYGMDFQNGGSYFQNINSVENFTFVSQFYGCEQDTAYNILVDPKGTQYQCSNTPLRPDDTDEMSTCPLQKNQLWSGPWSVLIISNNGNGDPIAYERDFSLSVGVQSTITVTPTVTNIITVTPVVNSTTTSVSTTTTTLPPKTTTVPSTTIKPTVTVTPQKVTSTSTITLATVTIRKVSLSVTKSVITKTASCHYPRRQPTRDPTCKIKPTIPGITASALQTTSPGKPKSAKFRGFREVRDTDANINMDLEQWLKERDERLAAAQELEKRAPDPQPLTVTDTDTADWITTSSTSSAPAITVPVTAVVTTTQTVTPTPITVMSGKTVAPPVTVTAPTPTKTKTVYTVAKTTTTKVQTVTVKVTTTTTPAAIKTACRRAGGVLY